MAVTTKLTYGGAQHEIHDDAIESLRSASNSGKYISIDANGATVVTDVATKCLALSGGTMTGVMTFSNGKTIADYLPLTGGTLSGDLSLTASNVFTNGCSTFSLFTNTSDGHGSTITLHSYSAGKFQIQAKGASGTSALEGTASGNLTWVTKEIERINTSGTNYIRYESGIQICWNYVTVAALSDQSLTYPLAFTAAPYLFSGISFSRSYLVPYAVEFFNTTATGTDFCFVKSDTYATGVVYILSIGRWK